MNVFVYGTLLSGCSNHRFLKDSRLLGYDTINGLSMHNLGHFPACVETNNEEDTVFGEVYSIDDVTLENLDSLEGYPTFYDRVPVSTRYGAAWIYICNRASNRERIVGGNWKEYVRESDGF